MKKLIIIFVSFSLIFLLGCSEEKGSANGDKNIEHISTVENDKVNEYEEISKISEKINLKDYNINVESDNKGTRIILFEKNGKKIYKSVFVKEEKHLKLIDLESGEELLINENI